MRRLVMWTLSVDRQRLRLLDSRVLATGSVVLRYAPGDDGGAAGGGRTEAKTT
jgi:hypothetical protein